MGKTNQKRMGLSLMIFGILVCFQNCTKGFSQKEGDLEISATSQCLTKLAEDRFSKFTSEKLIDCNDLNNYKCQVSNFSPEVSDGTQVGDVCDLESQIPGCIEVKAISFNTSSLLDSGEERKEFEIGGAYNREDIRCSLYGPMGELLKTVVSASYAAGIKTLNLECKDRSQNEL